MKMNYDLDGIGWAVFKIKNKNKNVEIIAGYLTEPLLLLVNILLEIVEEEEKKNYFVIDFDAEPAVHKMNIKYNYNGDKKIELKIELFNDGDIGEVSIIEYEDVIEKNEFIKSTVKMLEETLIKYGIVGYRKTWHESDFPLGGYLILKSFLEGEILKLKNKKNVIGMDIYKTDIIEECEQLILLKNMEKAK